MSPKLKKMKISGYSPRWKQILLNMFFELAGGTLAVKPMVLAEKVTLTPGFLQNTFKCCSATPALGV